MISYFLESTILKNLVVFLNIAAPFLQTLSVRNKNTMRKGIHPEYREVVFLDQSNGTQFIIRSCASSRETIKLDDGRELPLFKLETSSESHPFYTGSQKSVDSMGGRVERFRNKFGSTASMLRK